MIELAGLPTIASPGCAWRSVHDGVPRTGTVVLYRTNHYQMMGYLNAWGQWIGSDGKIEEWPVVWWREIRGPEELWADNEG